MWKPFGRHDDADEPRPEGDAPEAPASPPTPQVHLTSQSGIAEFQMMGQVVVATLTVTELSQDEGAEALATLLDEMAETGAQHLVLDVQNVQFMDTTCLGCLVEALNKLSVNGGHIALASPNHNVQYVFRLTRLDRVFRICSDVMSAIDVVEGRKAAG